jgi:hypothetical protein
MILDDARFIRAVGASRGLARLVRSRRELPRRRAAEKCDEFASFQLMESHRHRASRERRRQNIELTGISQPSRGPDGLRPKGKGEWPDKGPARGHLRQDGLHWGADHLGNACSASKLP